MARRRSFGGSALRRSAAAPLQQPVRWWLRTRRALASPSARRGTSFTRADRVGFEEAMVYYHVDAAIRFIESLGYTGGSRIFKTPLRANAGFGDYLAASFFAKRKRHEFQTLVMIWDAFETSEETPRLRTVDSTLTCESFDHDADADEHENGRIWSATFGTFEGVSSVPRTAIGPSSKVTFSWMGSRPLRGVRARFSMRTETSTRASMRGRLRAACFDVGALAPSNSCSFPRRPTDSHAPVSTVLSRRLRQSARKSGRGLDDRR
jgi:hypothetical protein